MPGAASRPSDSREAEDPVPALSVTAHSSALQASSKPAWAQGTEGGRGRGPHGARWRLVSEAVLSQLQVSPWASTSAQWDQCGQAAPGGPFFGARSHGTVGWAQLFADVVFGGPGWLPAASLGLHVGACCRVGTRLPRVLALRHRTAQSEGDAGAGGERLVLHSS